MFLDKNDIGVIICTLVQPLLWPIECYAHGGVGSLKALSLLFSIPLIIIPISLILVAYRLRKKRKPTNWLMLVLMAPTFFAGLFMGPYMLLMLFNALLEDITIEFTGLWVLLLGFSYLIATGYLFLSSKHYHERKT